MLATDVDGTRNVRPIVGSATLTIVTSMIVMNIAATYTTLTATFWLTRLIITGTMPRRPVFFRSREARRYPYPDALPRSPRIGRARSGHARPAGGSGGSVP